MSEADTISMYMVKEALYDIWSEEGARRTWLTGCGIDPAQLEVRHARIPAAAFARLWRRSAKHCDDEFFNMDARGLPRGSFALLCQIGMAQPTLGMALDSVLTLLGVLLHPLRPHLVRRSDVAEIVLDEGSAPPRRAFAYFTLWLIVHGIACWLAGRRLPILAIDVRSDLPVSTADYRVMFTERLRFAQADTRLTLAIEHLALPVRRTPQALTRFLAGAPDNLLVRYRDPTSLARRIRQHLMSLEPATWPDAAALAHQHNLSVSTLRRRLSEEGQTYQRLKDSVRRELATAWLAGSSATLSEIAQRLGFADDSSFHRAFRKWCDCNPGHYRALSHAANT